MLENFIETIKEHIAPVITGNSDVPSDKKSETVDTTVSSIVDGLKNQLKSGGISEITNLFSEGNTEKSLGDNPLIQNIQSLVSSSLVSKIGLSSDVSSNIASSVIPVVVNLFNKKDGTSGLDIQSLIQSFTGEGEDGKEGLGGLLGKVGGFFGGK